jgi:hypothetical protein
MATKPIDQIVEIITKSEHKEFHRRLTVVLQRLIHKIQLDILDTKKKNEGYCVTFVIPEKDVYHLFDEIGITKDQINQAFSVQWQVPASARMHNNPYYHILLLCILLGAKTDNDYLAQNALTLMLFKLWNGRLKSSIPYCHANTMAYVVSNMMNRKYLPNKYATPLEMITQYFVGTIYTKYKPNIIGNSDETKRLFEQSFNRLRQIFRSGAVADLDSGGMKYSSGLQPLYFDARQKGLKISTTRSDEMSNPEDGNSSGFEDQVDNITNYIVTNSSPKYPTQFMEFLRDQSKSQEPNILIILNSLHKMEYVDYIKELLELIFRRISGMSQQNICAQSFMTEIQKRIISSKHNHEVNQIKAICDKLLQNILETKFQRPYNYMGYSDTNRSQLRRIVIYMLSYNIQKFNCQLNV